MHQEIFPRGYFLAHLSYVRFFHTMRVMTAAPILGTCKRGFPLRSLGQDQNGNEVMTIT